MPRSRHPRLMARKHVHKEAVMGRKDGNTQKDKPVPQKPKPWPTGKPK